MLSWRALRRQASGGSARRCQTLPSFVSISLRFLFAVWFFMMLSKYVHPLIPIAMLSFAGPHLILKVLDTLLRRFEPSPSSSIHDIHTYVTHSTNKCRLTHVLPFFRCRSSLVFARLLVVWNGSIQEPACVQRIPGGLVYVLETVWTKEGAAEIPGDYDEDVVDVLRDD
jgi:hypothetical protein